MPRVISSEDKRNWLIGDGSIETLALLANSFRDAAKLSVKTETEYLPWMSSFSDHGASELFRPHQIENHILVDEGILSEIETRLEKDGYPMGLLLSEEKSFRTIKRTSGHNDLMKSYKAALDFFLGAGDYWKNVFSTLCNFIVPIYSIRESVRAGGVGFSSLHARGAIFLSNPREPKFAHIELAINIAHELGHQALMIYQGADRLLTGDLEAPIYSAVRQTMRPAIMSFHALVALSFMVSFVNDAYLRDLPDEEREYLAEKLEELLNGLHEGISSCRNLDFTDIGNKLFNECATMYDIISRGNRATV